MVAYLATPNILVPRVDVEEARPFRFESDWFPLFGSVGAPSRRAMEQADRSVNSIFF
jgi:hypothetical protein